MHDRRSRYGDQPIAIVGMSGSYPGGRDLDAFWDLLRSGRDGVEAVSEEDLALAGISSSLHRDPNYIRACTPLASHDGFDAAFFGVAPAEAQMTDPQHRHFLQHSYLALEQAGYASARGDLSIGVFGGMGVPSYMIELALNGVDRTAATTIMPFVVGTDKDYLATAVAYRLDLHGPAMTVQTACSTSLVAVHVAVQSLLARECDLALAGGASVRVPHRVGYMFQDGGIMSRDGYCRPFDESGTGTIFGSGVGVVALRRLDDAMAAGDPIRAVILGTAVNNDGARKVGYVAPSVDGQVAVISEALGVAGLDPDQVDYIEAHGTGTRIGDAIEATGLSRVYASEARRREPCLVGSVKSNIGHVEAAAGVVALSKTVLALEHGWLPPSLFIHRPIPEVTTSGALEMVMAGHPWPRRGELRVAGVSSFGVGGTNAHVVVASAPERTPRPARPQWHVARLTARTASSLAAMAGRTAEWLMRNPDVDPAAVAASLDHGRAHLQHRAAVPFRSIADLSADLQALGDRVRADEELDSGGTPDAGWLFSGQGTVLRGVAKELCAESDVVARAIDEADAVLKTEFDVPVRAILVDGTLEPTEPHLVQPLGIALQLALIRFWDSRGLKPSVVLGHSLGEISAAIASGHLTWDSALRFAAARGQIMQGLCQGAMLAVKATPEAVRQLLAASARDDISVAAVNAPEMIVLAGPPNSIAAAKAAFDDARVPAMMLSVFRAYHSPMVEPALDAIGEAARLLRGGASPRATLISTVTGDVLSPQTILDPLHWRQHARQTVMFEAAVRCALSCGASQFLEIGAESQLGVHVKAIAPDASIWTTLTGRDRSLRSALNAGIGLYASGAAIDLVAASPSTPRVAIAGYAFESKRYWIQSIPKTDPPPGGSHTWTFSIGPKSQPYLSDHRIAGRIVVPGAFHVELAMAVARELLGASAMVTDVVFHQPLFLSEDDDIDVRLSAIPVGRSAAAFSIDVFVDGRPLRVASGQLVAPEDVERETQHLRPPTKASSIAVDAFYTALAVDGLEYGQTFRGIVGLRSGRDCASAEVRIAPALAAEIPAYVLHPAVLDACLQVGAAAIERTAEDRTGHLPVAIRRVRALRTLNPGGVLDVVAERRYTTSSGAAAIDIQVSDAQGVIAIVDGLLLGQTGALESRRRSGRAAFHRLRWMEIALTVSGRQPVLVVAHPGDALADALSVELRGRGISVLVASCTAANTTPRPFNGSGSARRIVYLGPPPCIAADVSDVSDAVWRACGSALEWARAMPRAATSSGFAIVTRGAMAPDGGPRDAASAGLWGCGTSMISERPDLQIRLVDIDPAAGPPSLVALADAVLADGAENRIAVRGDKMLAPRLEPFEPSPCPPAALEQALRLGTERPGDLDELSFGALPKPEPGPSEVLVKVEAASLNFLDVLAALGQRPDLPPGPCTFLGSECAGVVKAVGKDVRELAMGDNVVGIVSGSIATHVLANAADMQRYAGLAPQEACAVPVCYGTAEYALRTLAHLREGESVLIHAATGGVGMAAIAVARSIGARILATAGSDAKRDELRRLGIGDVFDSRSLSFVEGVREATGGRGVDVVLNTLTGPLLQGGIEALSPFGRFVDIAKRDIHAGGSIALGPFGRNLSYAAFDLIRLHRERPDELRTLIAGVLDRVSTGVYARVPITSFPATKTTDAFRLMARARHVGKIVVDFSQTPEAGTRTFATFRADGAYVITGGLGALGIAIAARMVAGGARHLVLIARRQASPEVASTLATMRTAGCEVTVLSVDATDVDALRLALAKLSAVRPIRGAVHAAGILDDAMIEATDEERFRRVMRPKVRGLEALSSALAPEALDFLIAFSSASAIFAPPGQTAYAAANAAMEAVASSVGARVIRWGSWAGGGMASRSGANDVNYTFGLPPLLVADGTEAFARFVAADVDDCAIFATNPDCLDRGARQFGAESLLQDLVGQRQRVKDSALLSVLAAGDTPQERIEALIDCLAGEVAKVLGTAAEDVDVDQDFRSMGVDSLMALELAKRLERSLGVPLNPALFALHPTIAKVGHAIAATIGLV